MIFDSTAFALSGEAGFPGSQLAAQKQAGINMIHTETPANPGQRQHRRRKLTSAVTICNGFFFH